MDIYHVVKKEVNIALRSFGRTCWEEISCSNGVMYSLTLATSWMNLRLEEA